MIDDDAEPDAPVEEGGPDAAADVTDQGSAPAPDDAAEPPEAQPGAATADDEDADANADADADQVEAIAPSTAGPDAALEARLELLESKLDTIAGAVAAVAASQTDILRTSAEHEGHRSEDALDVAQRLDALERQVDQLAGTPPEGGSTAEATAAAVEAATASLREDMALALDVLARLAESLERSDAQAEDRIAALRDAASVPLQDLQALLTARVERSDAELAALTGRVEAAVTAFESAGQQGSAGDDEAARSAARVSAAADRIGERVEELGTAVQSLSWQLPEITRELASLRERVEGLAIAGPAGGADEELGERFADLGEQVTHHTDAAMATLLRLVDERLTAVREQIEEAAEVTTMPPPPPPPAAGMGFEAGAVMGAAQAAWTRLEQRIDSEFDDLGRQLQAMAVLIERALATAEAAANRPVVTSDQLRGAATSVKDTILGLGRTRRERRGGPRGLGPGSGSS